MCQLHMFRGKGPEIGTVQSLCKVFLPVPTYTLEITVARSMTYDTVVHWHGAFPKRKPLTNNILAS